LRKVDQVKIPWGDKDLLRIPGAHDFLRADMANRKRFDAYIGALHYTGPQTME
jgi:hypothetical protein